MSKLKPKQEKKIKEILKSDNLTYTNTPHKHSRQKGEGKYSIDTPIVQEFARYRAIPPALRPDGYKTDEEFLTKHGYSENSRHTLSSMQQVPGFWELRQKYARQYHAYFVTVADENVLKLAEGIKVQEQVWDFDEKKYKDEVFETPPNFKAIEFIKKAWDGFQEKSKLEIDLSLQSKWIEACKKASAEEKK